MVQRTTAVSVTVLVKGGILPVWSAMMQSDRAPSDLARGYMHKIHMYSMIVSEAAYPWLFPGVIRG